MTTWLTGEHAGHFATSAPSIHLSDNILSSLFSGPPQPPVGPIVLSDLDKTTVTLTWKPPTSDGGSDLTGYIIERREAARTQWTKLDSSPPDQTTITTRNLVEGYEYYFRVCAENRHGHSDWLETESPVKMRSPFGKLMCWYIVCHVIFNVWSVHPYRCWCWTISN